MDIQKIKNFKSQLLKERDERKEVVENMRRSYFGNSQQEEIQELSMYDNHPADIASETFEMEKNIALIDNELNIIEQIDQALKRIDEGKYGICTHCGKEIEMERLEAIPYASLCISCSREHENLKQIDKNSRPVEEKILKNLFKRNFGDVNDEVMFDGEDAWQAVAIFNKTRSGLDNYDERYDEENAGVVEETDKISNQQYKNRL